MSGKMANERKGSMHVPKWINAPMAGLHAGEVLFDDETPDAPLNGKCTETAMRKNKRQPKTRRIPINSGARNRAR
jgi:hypothetical protein